MSKRKESKTSPKIVLFELLVVVGLESSIQAGTHTKLLAFGDSLSDAGNASLATGCAEPGPNYFNGRHSNGPVWIEYLADKLGIGRPTPSLLGGSDYAFGGAESNQSGTSILGTPNLGTQVGAYLSTGPTIGGETLITIWAGANDFLYGHQTDPTIPVANIVAAITALKSAGGSQFLADNLPMLGSIPATSGLTQAGRDGLNFLARAFNALLGSEVASLEQSLGITIHYLDIDQYLQQLAANPSAFGLTNATIPMQGTGDTSGHLFWDTVHPTTQVHALIADLAFDVVAPEPSSIVMLGIAGVVLTAGAGVRRRRARWAA